MKKLSIVLALFFLFACSTIEEPTNPTEEPSLKSAIDITSDLTERLIDEVKVNAQDETVSDTEQLKEIWSNYATTIYIENALQQINPSESCADPFCDLTAKLPLNFMTSWEPEVEIITNGHFRLSGLFPISDEQHSHQSQK